MNVLNVNEKITYLYPNKEERSQDSEIWTRDSLQNILWQLGLPPLMSDTHRRTAIVIASITGAVLILAGIGSLIVILLSLPTLMPQNLSQIAILVSITLCLVVVTILGFKSWSYSRLIISPYTKIAEKHYKEIMERGQIIQGQVIKIQAAAKNEAIHVGFAPMAENEVVFNYQSMHGESLHKSYITTSRVPLKPGDIVAIVVFEKLYCLL